MILNLGSGTDDYGDVKMDRRPIGPCNLVGDIHYLPFRDNVFQEVKASHVLEHSDDAIGVLEEIYRISKDGATINILVPHADSINFKTDPTHKTSFTKNSMEYYKDDTIYPNWYTDIRFSVLEAKLVIYKYRFQSLLNKLNFFGRYPLLYLFDGIVRRLFDLQDEGIAQLFCINYDVRFTLRVNK